MTAAPKKVAGLDGALARMAVERGVPPRRLQRAVANTVLGQLLPAGVIKGGTGLKLRVGEAGSRFTPDFDTAFGGDLDRFEDDLADRLRAGWGDFTGSVSREAKANPTGVPAHYVMQPFRVRLQYQGKAWLSIDLELGHDEIGCTADPTLTVAPDLQRLFAELGLPEPSPMPVIAVHHQLAQKLHAVTSPGSERAHDLVDIQLLVTGELDLALVRRTAERLFRFRGGHAWPPKIEPGGNWASIYGEAASGLAVLPDVDSAVSWTATLIARIDAAGDGEEIA